MSNFFKTMQETIEQLIKVVESIYLFSCLLIFFFFIYLYSSV